MKATPPGWPRISTALAIQVEGVWSGELQSLKQHAKRTWGKRKGEP